MNKIQIFGASIITISLEINNMIENNKYYDQRQNNITKEFCQLFKRLAFTIENYNSVAYTHNNLHNNENRCPGINDIYPKSSLCNAKKSALFFSVFYQIRFPSTVLDLKDFIQHFYMVVKNIWEGIVTYSQNSENLLIAATAFKNTIDNMTRENYIALICYGNNNCYRLIAPLLCTYNIVMPRIIIFDSSDSSNTFNTASYDKYLEDSKISSSDSAVCQQNIISNIIGNPLKGGNSIYYDKYIKYKSKYLASSYNR